ncbi:MAG: VWA domain-containing protein [Planctomycetota bacterium]|nr:VWA domain-containing protein [Planctomycetota bacterium]
MKNATFIATSAVILSLAMTTVLLFQSSTRHASSPRSGAEVRFDESPAPTLDPPDEIVVDLAGHAWSQLESAIQISADEKDTLVVWIVDQSSSMAERREEIADRFERTFGSQQAHSDNELLHSLISFGERVQQPSDQPTDDAGQIAAQFRKVEDDLTGVERTMQAVQSASEYVRSMWQKYQSWNRLFVIVTDERGDDYEMVDQVVKRCSRMGIRVFCLGNASPFGTDKGFSRYTYPDGFQVDIPVDQGPETIAHQTLQIPVIGQPVVEPAHISSGFGPYAIEWLCRETGGQFWIYQDTASERFLPGRMNDYRPDYISASDFAETTNFNRAKLALIDAALLSHKEMPRVLPIVVRGDVLNVLRTELTERQKECVAASSLVQKLTGLLESGLEDRAELDSLRWRASFDLA